MAEAQIKSIVTKAGIGDPDVVEDCRGLFKEFLLKKARLTRNGTICREETTEYTVLRCYAAL